MSIIHWLVSIDLLPRFLTFYFNWTIFVLPIGVLFGNFPVTINLFIGCI